jgi:hypothetical protein
VEGFLCFTGLNAKATKAGTRDEANENCLLKLPASLRKQVPLSMLSEVGEVFWVEIPWTEAQEGRNRYFSCREL